MGLVSHAKICSDHRKGWDPKYFHQNSGKLAHLRLPPLPFLISLLSRFRALPPFSSLFSHFLLSKGLEESGMLPLLQRFGIV